MISNALEFTVTFLPREDGGVRVYSDELIGLHLSFGPEKSMAEVAKTVEASASYLILARLARGQPLLKAMP